jgi:hypothetical protein
MAKQRARGKTTKEAIRKPQAPPHPPRLQPPQAPSPDAQHTDLRITPHRIPRAKRPQPHGGTGAGGACRSAPAEPPGGPRSLPFCAARHLREGVATGLRGMCPRAPDFAAPLPGFAPPRVPPLDIGDSHAREHSAHERPDRAYRGKRSRGERTSRPKGGLPAAGEFIPASRTPVSAESQALAASRPTDSVI